ncbi:MAG: hypothetical protein IPH35_12730 [Rhodoferax sp.]|nr:hypothetical protein [Rhodoferax sp.]
MPKKINLVLFKPDTPRFKILDSYQEVIASLHWGFDALGYQCSFTTNAIDRSCQNIFFGWLPAIQSGLIDEFPADTILYNLEQYSMVNMKQYKLLEIVAERFQIWDYSLGNVRRWNELNPKFPAYYAKVSFAPSLMKIAPSESEDIDILYIGCAGPIRAESLITTCSTISRHSLVTLSNIWDKQRDDFIARSKLVLNVRSEHPMFRIFEIVRVSYYLANRKAVVCELVPQLEIEEDLRNLLRFVPREDMGAACDDLILNPEKRKAYADECFEAFRRRDVRDVIKGFFD